MTDKAVRIINILIDSFIPLLKAGIGFTVPLSIISFTLGLTVAFLVAIIRVLDVKPLASITKFYVWIVRGTPLLVQLFIIFYGLPSVGITINAFISATIGFTLSVGAYGSEIVRAAIKSVPKGQWEASYALGLNRKQTLIYVVLPQAVKVSIPSLANSFISLVKDTSLAATITVRELFQVGQQITARTYEPLWLYLEVALIYLIFSTILTSIQSKMESQFDRYMIQ